MPHRPLAIVSGLAIGDYLLWNWSLSHSHDVLALISGLTLPPLAIACLWLLAVSLARLLARTTRRAPVQSTHSPTSATDLGAQTAGVSSTASCTPQQSAPDAAPTSAPATVSANPASPRKLAA